MCVFNTCANLIRDRSRQIDRLNATNQPSIKTRVQFPLGSLPVPLPGRCCVDPCAASSNWHKSLMEFIHYGHHQATATAAGGGLSDHKASMVSGPKLEIGKPTMDPKGARLAFYACIVNSPLPLPRLHLLMLRFRDRPAITSNRERERQRDSGTGRYRLAADFPFWSRCVWHKAKALKDNTFLTPSNKVVCVCGQHEMKHEYRSKDH